MAYPFGKCIRASLDLDTAVTLWPLPLSRSKNTKDCLAEKQCEVRLLRVQAERALELRVHRHRAVDSTASGQGRTSPNNWHTNKSIHRYFSSVSLDGISFRVNLGLRLRAMTPEAQNFSKPQRGIVDGLRYTMKIASP